MAPRYKGMINNKYSVESLNENVDEANCFTLWWFLIIFSELFLYTSAKYFLIFFKNVSKIFRLLHYHCSQGTDYIYETCMEPFFYKHSQSVDQDWVHFRNQVVEISKSLCNKALLAMQLKLTGVIREHVVTRHPVVSIVFSL